MTILDYEAGKFIYTESITKSQIEKSQTFDFLLNMQKKDNIKLDTVNLKTDLQFKASDSYPINNIQIFDENKNLIKTITYNDVSKFSENNIISDLEVGKNYIIRANLSDPVDFNIIRNYKENKVKFLGESNDNHFNEINNVINYTKEDEKKNNNIFKEELKKTVKIARFVEKLYGEPCIRQFKKITDDEITLNGNSILSDKVLFKVANDLKNQVLKAFDMINNKEIISIDEKNKKITLFEKDITNDLKKIFEKSNEWLLDDNKIIITNDKNEEISMTVDELKNYKGNVKSFNVITLDKRTNSFGKEEISIKNNIFSNKEDAIKKLQDIAKNNAGLIKDFMTGGVEFENPKIFKNFLNNFYPFPEHIIAFKCEKNAINEIKSVLKRILNPDIKINSIQEIWETILDELINGFIIGGNLPFISLHFNEDSLLYSVMNMNYKHTITGHILTFIDYFLKGFTNGAFFNEKFVYDWYENQSQNFSNSINECKALSGKMNNIFKYIYDNKLDIIYETTDGLFPDMLKNSDEQLYLAANRIIGKMNDEDILNYDENILYPEFNFKVEGDLDPLPPLIKCLNEKPENRAKWEKTKKAHEEIKKIIKLSMNKLPILKGYFYLLDMITFAIYYLTSIKSLSALPDTKNSIKNQCSNSGKFYLKVIPSVFPPLPTTKYIEKELDLSEKFLKIFDSNLINEIKENIFNILNNNLDESFNDELKRKIKDEIERIINMEIYNEFKSEISNINEIQYSVKKIKNIYENYYPIFDGILQSHKEGIKELIEYLNIFKDKYPDESPQIKSIDIKSSLLKQLNEIKAQLEIIYKRVELDFTEQITEKIIKKGLLKDFTNFLQVFEIAEGLNDEELNNKIKKYKEILNTKYILNLKIEVLEKKDFFKGFKFHIKPKINLRKVGYHEGKYSYRGGCLVDFNKEIELKEKKDINKLQRIKEAIKSKKEEIQINEDCYFLVKTKMNPILYDKKTLMEINLLKSSNFQKIIHNLSKGYNDNLKIENGLSQIFLKLLSKNKKIINSINQKDLTKLDESKENSLMHIPAIKNSNFINDILEKNNLPFDAPCGNNKITPLLSSISVQNLKISEILINKKMNINDSTDIKFTPLHFSSYYNLPKIAKLLLRNGAKDDIKTKKEGETPLHVACRKGNFEIVEILLNNNKWIINNTKSDKKTGLHLACTTSSLCTKILLDKGADKYLKDNNDCLASKLSLIYGREDIFNMIGCNDNAILEFYDKIKKYDNDNNDSNKILESNNYIKNLCKFMRKNKLEMAKKISDLMIQNKDIMIRIKNDKKIQEKIIRNACKGISIDYLYIILKLIELKQNPYLIYENIYKYYLSNWIPELEKNGIIFNKIISKDNWNIISYLFINDIEEFENLMNTFEQISDEYLSNLLYIKCKYKIEFKGFEEFCKKFNPKSINIEQFSKTPDIDIEDLNYLLKYKDIFHIDFSTFNIKEMIKNSRPSVVRFILSNNEFMKYQNINLYDLKNIARINKRLDNLQILEINKEFSQNMANIFSLLIKKEKKEEKEEEKEKEKEEEEEEKEGEIDIDLNNIILNFNLFEFDEHGTIFNLINEKQKFSILDKIRNFPINLLNKDILFKNIDKIIYENILEIKLKDIVQHYLNFFINIKNSQDIMDDDLNNTKIFNYFIELIDIILKEQSKFYEFNEFFEKTVDSLIKVLSLNSKYIPYIISSKNSQNQNIMHVLVKYKIFTSEKLKEKLINLLEIFVCNCNNKKLIKNLFNDKDRNTLTFLKRLLILEKNELFCDIYLKYKSYIKPFTYEKLHNNILHYIIMNLRDDSTQKGCLDKFMLIIKDIIINNPDIIFSKNILNQSPLFSIIINNNNMTGPLNLIFKAFSYETLKNKEKESLLSIILKYNNLFMLRYLIEYHHIKINQILEDDLVYPLNYAAIHSKIDEFQFLIQYGANPFLKNGENQDTINYAMIYSDYSFLEYLYNMKISDLCFKGKYLFDLVTNKKGYEIFIKLIREKKIELNIVNSKNETLLMKACQSNNYELINILINYGISPMLKDENNNTAIHHCCIHNSINALNVLLQKFYYSSLENLMKVLSLGNINDDTPLHLSSKLGHLEIVQKILVYSLIYEKNKNIRFKSKGEFLPIHYAIINDKIEVALFLIKALDINDEEIKSIEKDSFYDKIIEFLNSKNEYINTYEKKINFYMEKLNYDINILKSDYAYNQKLHKINEINEINDILELKYSKEGIQDNFKEFLNILNQGNNININNQYKIKLLKYYNYLNKSKMIRKINELNNKGKQDYIFNLLDCLDKTDWMKYVQLEIIVNLFICNILPFIQDNKFKKSIETLNLIINNDLLKDKRADNFLSWIETIIISISEDISEFPTEDIIIFIEDFYHIILEKLNCSGDFCGLEILSKPDSNIKFYYFIKQLITILKNKNKELCIIQLKNINYIPSIIFDNNTIENSEYSIFHHSILYKNDELYNIMNNIIRNHNIHPKILDITISIFNQLLYNIDYYEINGSLYKQKLMVMENIESLINNNMSNIDNLELVLNYIKNNLVKFCNDIYYNYININNINSFFSIIEKEEIIKEQDINRFIEMIDENSSNLNEIEEINNLNNNDSNKLLEFLDKLKISRKTKKYYNFPINGRKISKEFFSEPNIKNLVELVNLLIEGLISLNFNIDIKQIIIFSNFMLFYTNKSTKLKGRIGQYYFENKNIIIAMLALSHSLNNKNVDIITSSNYIAKKNYEEYKKLYDLFNIKSNSISSSSKEFSQVLYGTLSDFKLNILFDKFHLDNNFKNVNQIRKNNILLFDEISIMIDNNSLSTSYAFSNNFIENNIWAYKPIYNYMKDLQNKDSINIFTLFFLDFEKIKNILRGVNNGQYEEKVDFISNEILYELISSAFFALSKQKNIDYIKEIKNGVYKISLLNKSTGNVEQNLRFSKYLQAFIEIKETIIPTNIFYNLGKISKFSFINYNYQNIFCLGGVIDDKRIYDLYNVDSFDCEYNYKRPSLLEANILDKNSKFEYIKNNICENDSYNCNILVLFLNYFEANEFSDYLKNNSIQFEFIHGEINEDLEKKIYKFESEKCTLISTYDCLKGRNFTINNYAINKYHLIFAFKTQYSEKVYNSLMKCLSINKNKNIELSGIIINNGNFDEKFFADDLINYNKIEISNYKKLIEISEYQNILIRFLNSNEIKNMIKVYFSDNLSISSFIQQCVNYYRFKWCLYQDKNKEINTFEFLNSIHLDDLLFYLNDFNESIQNDFLNFSIILNLVLQLNNITYEFFGNKSKYDKYRRKYKEISKKIEENLKKNDIKIVNNKSNSKNRNSYNIKEKPDGGKKDNEKTDNDNKNKKRKGKTQFCKEDINCCQLL